MAADIIIRAPNSPINDVPNYLIFFITGNPGLIGYYDSFLSTLDQLLNSGAKSINGKTGEKPNYYVYGRSLAGFEDTNAPDRKLHSKRRKPYSLNDQIQMTYEALLNAASPNGPTGFAGTFDGVILIGHSVGSYILMEMLRLSKSATPLSSQSLPQITAGILLFPTVTHISLSPRGVKLSSLFQWVPSLARGVDALARVLVGCFPGGALLWLIKTIVRMPPDAAAVTARFLRTRGAVEQALHMARDEMEQITEDRWDADIWGVEHIEPTGDSTSTSTPVTRSRSKSSTHIPKLVFYFGQDDHWVADHTRDALIAARAGNEDAENNGSSKPIMLIDQDGLPHSFCIRHGESVAEKVKLWIENIVSGTA